MRHLPDTYPAGNTTGMVIQSRPHNLLLTRPHKQSVRFARQLRKQAGYTFAVTHAPLMRPVFLHPVRPAGEFQAVIFTSETAVEAATAYKGLPSMAYCVGDHTARAARRAGFLAVSAAGDAASLVAYIQQAAPMGDFLHICGVETRGSVAQSLTAAGIRTQELVAYRQDAVPFSLRAQRLLGGKKPVIVPLFSPRTAKYFVANAEPICNAPLYVAAFSPAVATCLQGMQMADLAIADAPTAAGMIATIRQIAHRLATA